MVRATPRRGQRRRLDPRRPCPARDAAVACGATLLMWSCIGADIYGQLSRRPRAHLRLEVALLAVLLLCLSVVLVIRWLRYRW